jgi:NADP-dependent 3-hydroxy acid dehydrogenase YdfG
MDLMKYFSDTTVLISGGSSGIGRALAEEASAHGARVGLIGTSASKLADTAAAIRKKGGVVATAQFNVADQSAWEVGVPALEAELGPIDHLFLNAGVGTGSTDIEDVTEAIWRWIWEVNVLGAVHGLHTCLPGMKRRGREGHILITSSVAALAAIRGLAPYAITKSALVALAESLRTELKGSRLGVSVLIPAAVKTEFSETSSRLAPKDFGNAQAEQVFNDIADVLRHGIAPKDVATFVLQRIADGAFYICTHPDAREAIAARQRELLAAIPTERPLELGA